MTKSPSRISFKWWSKLRTDWLEMIHTISTGRTSWSKLVSKTEWSTSQPTLKSLISSVFSKSIERSVKLSKIIRRPRKPEVSLMNSFARRPSDKGTQSELLKSRSCKTLKPLKKLNSSSSVKLGTTTWVITRPQLTFPLKSWRRSTWLSSRSSRWKSEKISRRKWSFPRIS